MRLLLVLTAALVLATPVKAELPPAILDGVGADPAPDARLDTSRLFTDQHGRRMTLEEAIAGRPTLLVFADYTCGHLCGPALVIAAAGLDSSDLQADEDYSFVAIGMDPRDGPEDAQAMARERFAAGSGAGRSARLLSGDAAALGAAARDLGYRFAYDPAVDQFAHPAVAYVLTPDGRVSALLSELELTGDSLGPALIAARHAPSRSVGEILRALCYGFDPRHGAFNRPVRLALTVGGSATILALGLTLLAFWRRERRA